MTPAVLPPASHRKSASWEFPLQSAASGGNDSAHFRYNAGFRSSRSPRQIVPETIITEKIMYPKMEGAIVIAKGAQNTIVKENITHAVEAATGLAVHKIQVFEMK